MNKTMFIVDKSSTLSDLIINMNIKPKNIIFDYLLSKFSISTIIDDFLSLIKFFNQFCDYGNDNTIKKLKEFSIEPNLFFDKKLIIIDNDIFKIDFNQAIIKKTKVIILTNF